MTRTLRICAFGLTGTLLFAACSRSGDNPIVSQSSTATATTAAVPTATAMATIAPKSSVSPTQAAARKVSANNASKAELQQAFEAAGVPSNQAGRWAGEVEEYRPYPTDDPNFTKLRRELAKYNPGPGIVDKIISTLSLP